MQELDDYINRVKRLPPAPTVLPKLLMLLNEPNIDSSRVVDLITYDPSLTASVLHACNSAFMAAGGPVDSLQEAVTRLGFQPVFQLVAAVSGTRALSPAQTGYGMEAGDLWKHSVTTAVAAQLIARKVGDNDSVAFTGALLHDIGKVILSNALEHIYTKLIEETETNQSALVETEKRLLGVNHAEVGGRLLARWKFPAHLVAAVWFHHNPSAAKPHVRLASCIYLGDLIAHFLGHGYGHQAFALRGRAEALDVLGLLPEDLPHLMIETVDNYSTVEGLFSIGGGN